MRRVMNAPSAIRPILGGMRTAYRCRAYPDAEQQVLLNRTFGCVRVVWNRTLAARRARYAAEHVSTSYAQTDRALTAMKRDPELAWLGEVSCVPLQQALRHQHAAFGAFFAQRARYPRFKSRRGRQSATFTRSAFRMRGTDLHLAKMSEPLKIVWTWPGTRPCRPELHVGDRGPGRGGPVVRDLPRRGCRPRTAARDRRRRRHRPGADGLRGPVRRAADPAPAAHGPA